MARRPSKREVTPLERLATSHPRFTVLGDHPLEAENYVEDSFGLARRLGPAFDIIRHPDTKTPLAVAIYGAWGSGKTSAMRVMEGMANTWTKKGKPAEGQKKIKLRSVWFYPWKYHTREDVWRGLVAKVILSCILVESVTFNRFATALRRFGGFLGKSVIKTLTNIKLSVGVAEIDLAKIRDDVFKDWQEVNQPEKAFLNRFEEVLGRWIADTIGENERMVIFIDDLDRCLPEVALEVLEALKLYLNIPRLVFVVGVDKDVIESLVAQHYEPLGLGKDQSAKYLAKMFQVEVTLGASGSEIKDFLEKTISATKFEGAELEPAHREVFANVVGSLAGRNPRDVKRLVSSSVMVGAGAVLTSGGEASTEKLEFAQGIQSFLLHTILERRFHSGQLVFNENAQEFFEAWSRLLRQGENVRPHIPEAAMLAETSATGKYKKLAEAYEQRRSMADVEPLPEEYAAYEEIWNNSRWLRYRRFLGDADLGELMKIPFPPPDKATGLAEAVTTTEPAVDPVLAAVAAKLNKAPTAVTPDDLKHVKRLVLSGMEIGNISALKGLTGLTTLDLTGTGVSDINVVENLTALKTLWLAGTGVSDISVLASLTGLISLDLSMTGVSDISVLEKLTGLNWLDLRMTRVSDISVLANLTSLKTLSLRDTGASDISVLGNLTGLETLWLGSTGVSDISALGKLTSLEILSLDHTGVSDISALGKLTSLEALYLGGTGVSDISVLGNLTGLNWLYLGGTGVSDISVLGNLTSLETLYLGGTDVSDIKPLENLKRLKRLDLGETKVPAGDVEEFKKSHPDCQVRS